MDKQKEIEEMLPIIQDNEYDPEYGCGIDIATALVNAGYGNVKQAVKEFAEKLKERRQSIIICTGAGEVTATGDLIRDEDIENLINEMFGKWDKV